MAIHCENNFASEGEDEQSKVYAEYEKLGLSASPFKKVKYFIPYSSDMSSKQSTYLSKNEVDEYISEDILSS